tara:strand:+ start:1937 stop:2845 length:909 start_codon:yes stop_codon:yes gene_type:complete
VVKLPSGIDVNRLIEDLITLSWEVSEILLYYSQMLKDSNDKINILKNDNNDDPVTLADLKVNELIIKRINEKYSGINWDILSEENVKVDFSNFDKNVEWLWVIDPLDGTKDFIQGTNNYAMHLALNYKGKPLIGVVLIPEKDELWISNGDNVWCQGKDQSRKKTNLSKGKSLNEMVLVTSKNHRNENLRILIEKIGFNETKIMGSIGCKISSILRGESDIYICLSLPNKSCPKDWDFAAPEAILKAAGGAITNLDNEELSYGNLNFEQGGIIIASSDKKTHKQICLEIKDLVKKHEIYPLGF